MQVQHFYKIKNSSPSGTKIPTPKQKSIQPRPLQSIGCINSGDTMEEAAVAAAYRIAEAENKSFVASEAVKEAERVSKMAEDTDSLLQLAKEIFEKCKVTFLFLLSLLFHFLLMCTLIINYTGSQGGIVLMA